MKRFVLILSMGLSVLLFSGAGAMAQNGNGNGNGNGNSQNNGFVVGQSLPYGTIPMSLAVKILKPATDIDFWPNLGLHLGQVIQTYKSGELVIIYIGKNSVEVRLRGCLTIIVVSSGL